MTRHESFSGEPDPEKVSGAFFAFVAAVVLRGCEKMGLVPSGPQPMEYNRADMDACDRFPG